MNLFKRKNKLGNEILIDESVVKIITETEPYTHKRYIELVTAFDEINARLGYKKYTINVNYRGSFMNIYTYIRKGENDERN